MSTHLIEAEELMAYFDGELALERAASVATHVAQCSECQKLTADMQSVSQRMAGWKVELAAAEMSESMRAELDERWHPSIALPDWVAWWRRLFCFETRHPLALKTWRLRRRKDFRKG
jgi:anti-sigma factor RsiW